MHKLMEIYTEGLNSMDQIGGVILIGRESGP